MMKDKTSKISLKTADWFFSAYLVTLFLLLLLALINKALQSLPQGSSGYAFFNMLFTIIKIIGNPLGIISALFFLWMFVDASGNKYAKNKNGWLGFLIIGNIIAAPIYYWVIYRKSRTASNQSFERDRS